MALVPNAGAFVTVEQATGAAGAAVTLTIPAVASMRHAITNILIMRAASTVMTGTARLAITTTNLPDAMEWTVGNAVAAGGTQTDVSLTFNTPLLSSVANTDTTIVLPDPEAGTLVIWTAQVFYYLVPEL